MYSMWLIPYSLTNLIHVLEQIDLTGGESCPVHMGLDFPSLVWVHMALVLYMM